MGTSNRSNMNLKEVLQMRPGHQVYGLDVSGDRVPWRDLSMWVQHFKNANEIRVPKIGHRTMTTCDPVKSECLHSFTCRTRGKGIHHFLLRSIVIIACFAQLHMIDKVACCVGSIVTSYRLQTTGRNQPLLVKRKGARSCTTCIWTHKWYAVSHLLPWCIWACLQYPAVFEPWGMNDS